MKYLKENIKYLRLKSNLTQDKLAELLGVKRATIGTYEDGRAEPKLSTLNKICKQFSVNYEELLNKDLSKYSKEKLELPASGQKLKILSIAVDAENKEFITYVPVKASAGYLDGYGDTEFISSLPKFNMPFPELSSFKTYRAFEIQGNSMLPIKPGSYILGEYIPDSKDIRDGACYVLLTKEDGVVYKRVKFQSTEPNTLKLKSDNKEYKPYPVHLGEILEVWKAVGNICFELPNEDDESHSLSELSNMVNLLQNEMRKLSKK